MIHKLLLATFLQLLFCWSPSQAEVVRYTDDTGRTHYVESEERVPEQYRSQLKGAKPLPGITKLPSATYQDTYQRKAKALSGNAKKVEIFVTSWCPYCSKLENYLNSKGIRYTKYDIEKNAAGRQIYQDIGGGGVPVVRIGTAVLRGFDPNAIERQLGRG